MSLKGFHAVVISLSALLCFVFGGWCLRYSQTEEGGGYLGIGIASFVAGAGLLAYVFWFWRKITPQDKDRKRQGRKVHAAPVVFAVWLLGQRAAEACSVCYGEAQGPMIDAARLGVWMLFGLVLAMQALFVMFFIYLRRRSRQFGEHAQG